MVNTRSMSSYKLRSRSILKPIPTSLKKKSIPSSTKKATLTTSRNDTLSDAYRKRLIDSLVPKSEMVYDEHYKKQCWQCANCAIEHYNELASKKGETLLRVLCILTVAMLGCEGSL